MKVHLPLLFVLTSIVGTIQAQLTGGFTPAEISQWRQQALNVTIMRDKWGVAHVYGKTDADAVFGMLYAQCEDDFERVERNYLTASGRLAEALGEQYVFHDLRTRLFQDSVMAMRYYKASPPWLKKLCQSFADGVNYYLYAHPQVKPKLITRFQPWMPFLFSEGSIGGDIESVALNEIKEFYGKQKGDIKEEVRDDGPDTDLEPRGSNGFAIGPSKSKSGNPLFLINPHTSFYFRSEIHVNSETGLNAYGAVTWGQFFIYQGFNAHCGWMHTSSEADVIDEYQEITSIKGKEFYYHFGNQVKQGTTAHIVIKYKTADGVKLRTFNTYYTQHGPITGQRNGKWIATRLMREPVKALTQSFTRTKAQTFAEFEKSMELRTNSSNNTVYADDQGNIAYWHGNYMPKRNKSFDWSQPVDGSNPQTEYQGLHSLAEMIRVKNPSTGWIQNTNNTPRLVSGKASPNLEVFPKYMAPDEENPRGHHAVRVLQDSTNFTLEKLIAAAYDSYLPAFESLIPALVKEYDALSAQDSMRLRLAAPIQMLRTWNFRFSETSRETTLAVYWGQKMRQLAASNIPAGTGHLGTLEFLEKQTPRGMKLLALSQILGELTQDFGTWRLAWGEVNRFQRISPSIDPVFDDAQPSVAVGFASAYWGSLASYGARRYPNTKKMYGTSGNSFVAVVEFGKRLQAKCIMVGGESSNPASPNFNDQGPLYAQGKFKDVLFYVEDVRRAAERVYYPGQ